MYAYEKEKISMVYNKNVKSLLACVVKYSSLWVGNEKYTINAMK